MVSGCKWYRAPCHPFISSVPTLLTALSSFSAWQTKRECTGQGSVISLFWYISSIERIFDTYDVQLFRTLSKNAHSVKWPMISKIGSLSQWEMITMCGPSTTVNYMFKYRQCTISQLSVFPSNQRLSLSELQMDVSFYTNGHLMIFIIVRLVVNIFDW